MIHHAELWQGGIMVASVEGSDKASVRREIVHYAMMYRQDGPVEILYNGKPASVSSPAPQEKKP